MQGPALTLRGTSRQWSWHVSADFCRLFETGSNSDIKRVAFGRNSKQIKGWCKKNSIRNRHSLLQALKGQNATIKTSKADRKLFVTDKCFSPGFRGFRWRVHSGDSFWFWGCANDGCQMWRLRMWPGWRERWRRLREAGWATRCKELRQKLAHLCKEAENTRVQSL